MRCYFIIVAFLLVACQDDSRIDAYTKRIKELEEENASLSEKIEELESSNKQNGSPASASSSIDLRTPTFIFVFIVNSESVVVGLNDNIPYYGSKNISYVTNILEVEGFDSDQAAIYKDRARSALCNHRINPCNIQGIYVRDFNRYSEASKAREDIQYKEEITIYKQ